MIIWYNPEKDMLALEGVYQLYWYERYYDVLGNFVTEELKSLYVPYPEEQGWVLIDEY